MDGASRKSVQRVTPRVHAVRGQHFYVQGGDGLFYASFQGRMDESLPTYAHEYETFEREARAAVLRAGHPYVSLFDMRRFGPVNANFARLAIHSFRDEVFRPKARAMLVTHGSWSAVQAQIMQIATVGAVRVFSADAVGDAVDYLAGHVPGAIDGLRDAVHDNVLND